MIERNYSPSLEGLRGVAAMLVVVNHLRGATPAILGAEWDRTFGRCGLFGVAIFFCLTGYLFWQRTALSKKSVDWSQFFINRTLRVAPAFLAAGMLIIVIAGVLSGWTLHEEGLTVLNQAFGQLSFGFARTDQLNGVQVTRFNAVAWTLVYEWKFYIALAALVAIRRVKHAAPLAAIIALFAILVCAPVWYMMIFFGTGMLSAEYLVHQRRHTVAGSFAVAILCGVWVFVPAELIAPSVASATGSQWLGEIARIAWMWTVGSLTFATVVATSPAILRSRPLVAVGTISYSLYLFHLFAIQGTLHAIAQWLPVDAWGPRMFIGWSAVAISAALVLAAASYRWVERPFLARKRPEREERTDARVVHLDDAVHQGALRAPGGGVYSGASSPGGATNTPSA